MHALMTNPLRSALARLGQSSPIVPTGAYVAAIALGSVLRALFPESALAALLFLLVWGTAFLLLWIVVTWYRDDDALAAGFLIGIALAVGAPVGIFASQLIRTGSIGFALFAAWGGILGRILWAIVSVLVAGGIVWLLRQATIIVRGRPAEEQRRRALRPPIEEPATPKRRAFRIPTS